MLRRLSYFLLFVVLLSGCNNLRPSLMMRTPKDYVFDSLPKVPDSTYRISNNDILEFRMYSNDGFKLIDMTMENSNSGVNTRRGFEYVVEFDGTCKFPIIGRTLVKGLTIREAEVLLEEKYTTFYNKPFILIKVNNRRVIIFPGSEGTAKVVPLENDNTTLLEALAQAGGIYGNGKAYKIKLIRGDPKNPKVYLIDLSTIDGFKKYDPILQANDIIYVESRPRYASRVLTEITPYISLITSMIVFYELLKRTK
jgi:polysaccharide export outer membrane protein